jgi:hypothetical protein
VSLREYEAAVPVAGSPGKKYRQLPVLVAGTVVAAPDPLSETSLTSWYAADPAGRNCNMTFALRPS